MVANKTPLNSTGTYHKKHKTTKKKYKPLNTIGMSSATMDSCIEEKTTWLDLVNSCHNNSINIKKEDELAFTEGKP
jgi:hypothetical protein